MTLLHPETLRLIAAAAALTYGLRLGGLLLADRLPQAPRFKAFMDALPGALLVALVAPGIRRAGLAGGIAAALTALCAYKTRNVFLAMLLGMGLVALQRYWGGA